MAGRTGNYNEEKTMYGNFGSLFIEDKNIAECTALNCKLKITKVEVPMCGTMTKKYKHVGYEGSGSFTLNKVSSRLILLMADNMKAGKESVFTLISKISDPGNGGTERIKFLGCKFDELTLADWGAGKLGTEQTAFTFEDFEVLDSIDESVITSN